ncbi:hypothetical protein MKK69_11565 [Methylobacterium sp. J-026]|nr:hypothetical protein [Methylobacterium sp. J-026]
MLTIGAGIEAQTPAGRRDNPLIRLIIFLMRSVGTAVNTNVRARRRAGRIHRY